MRVLLSCVILFLISQNLVSQSSFITTWQTATVNESITIPTRNGGYNYTVDWGDGTVENGATGDAVHTYASPGIYTVSISGDFPQIYFNEMGDSQKIRSVSQWGDIAWSSMAQAFAGCSQLAVLASDAPDLSAVTDMSGMFSGVANLNQDLSGWDVSTIENMANLFRNATSFNQPLATWSVDLVTNMSGMFEGAIAFNQSLNNWNVGVVTNMASMFKNATAFNQALDSWDISNVMDMSEFLSFTAISTENYDLNLQAWEALTTTPSGLTFGADGLTYCQGEVARKKLLQDNGWTFSGDARSTLCQPLVYYAIADGDWNDGTIWSVTPGGEPANQVPQSISFVETDSFQVGLTTNAECSTVLIGNKDNTQLRVEAASAHLIVFGDVIIAAGKKSGDKVVAVGNGGRLECR